MLRYLAEKLLQVWETFIELYEKNQHASLERKKKLPVH